MIHDGHVNSGFEALKQGIYLGRQEILKTQKEMEAYVEKRIMMPLSNAEEKKIRNTGRRGVGKEPRDAQI